LVVVIGVCLSVLILATASAQVCVPLGHSSLYLLICIMLWLFAANKDVSLYIGPSSVIIAK